MITWKNEYSVKVNEIDEQHKKLIDMINHLETAMRAGKGKDALESIFNGLVDYTKSHFATEERLMTTHQYPDKTAHLAEHLALTHKALDLQRKLRQREIGLAIPTADFLSNWLTGHILGMDIKLGAFLSAKAPSASAPVAAPRNAGVQIRL